MIGEFEKRGVPVLTVNAEDGEQANTKHIDDFIKILMNDYLGANLFNSRLVFLENTR